MVTSGMTEDIRTSCNILYPADVCHVLAWTVAAAEITVEQVARVPFFRKGDAR